MPQAKNSVERIMAEQVSFSGDCWNYTGGKDRDGYGRTCINGRRGRAHRMVDEALVGPIPEGVVIDHLCRNRSCLNPDHMEPVTNSENVKRGQNVVAINAKKTHCPKGHPYSGENLYVCPRGWRQCRACRDQ